jgi:CBS domain-containing protein
MNVKIKDLMVEAVISAKADDTVEHVRDLMKRNRIHAVPIVGEDGEAIGIVTSADLAADVKAGTHASEIMTSRVYKVPARRAELQEPTTDGFIRDIQSSFCEQLLHIAEAQGEPTIEPDRVADDLGREAVALEIYRAHRPTRQRARRDAAVNVTTPFELMTANQAMFPVSTMCRTGRPVGACLHCPQPGDRWSWGLL